MDDTALREFFTRPTHARHRQYEALRAVIVDGRSQKDVAETFGYQYHSLRQMVYEFRRSPENEPDSTESPFFRMFNGGVPSSAKTRRTRPRQSPIARR